MKLLEGKLTLNEEKVELQQLNEYTDLNPSREVRAEMNLDNFWETNKRARNEVINWWKEVEQWNKDNGSPFSIDNGDAYEEDVEGLHAAMFDMLADLVGKNDELFQKGKKIYNKYTAYPVRKFYGESVELKSLDEEKFEVEKITLSNKLDLIKKVLSMRKEHPTWKFSNTQQDSDGNYFVDVIKYDDTNREFVGGVSKKPKFIKEGVYSDCEKEIEDINSQIKLLKLKLKANTLSKEEKDKAMYQLDELHQRIADLRGQQAECRYIDNGNASDFSGYESLKKKPVKSFKEGYIQGADGLEMWNQDFMMNFDSYPEDYKENFKKIQALQKEIKNNFANCKTIKEANNYCEVCIDKIDALRNEIVKYYKSEKKVPVGISDTLDYFEDSIGDFEERAIDRIMSKKSPEEKEKHYRILDAKLNRGNRGKYCVCVSYNDIKEPADNAYFNTIEEAEEFKKEISNMKQDDIKSIEIFDLDVDESLKEAKDDDKKDNKKSSKKDTKKKDKKEKEDEEDIDIEDEVDIDIEEKDLPDVDVDDMLSLNDIDIDADEPIIDEPTEEIPQEIVSGAKLGELQNAVRDEFGSIDHLKSLIATITLDDENAQEGDEDLIDIINGVIDLKYELVGMLNKGIELLDGETVELMDKGEERAEDILDTLDDVDIENVDDISLDYGIEDNDEDVFGAGQELEVTDKFDVERPEEIDVDSASAKSLFDIDDEGEVTDELDDNNVIIKDKKSKK